MNRNEDIFKKLNKQTPLVKKKELNPLSSVDFKPERNKPKIQKNGNKPIKPVGYERNVLEEPVKKIIKRVGNKRIAKPGKVKENGKKNEPEIFSEPPKPAPKKAAPSKLEIFTDDSKRSNGRSPIQPAQRQYTANISTSEAFAAAESSLSFRHELKYYINYRDYIILRNSFKALMSSDPYAGPGNSYQIRSLYFDDIHDSALREKIAGNADRCKYRIRIYNFSDDVIKFEKKVKSGQYVAKKSIILSRDEYKCIFAGDYGFLKERDEELAADIYLQMKNHRLRPKVIVDYTREAYVSPFENCRVTFDKDLKAGLMMSDIFDPRAPVMPMYESGLMVLEIKFDKFLPESIKRVLNTVNAADRSAISKYVLCRKYD